MEPPPDVLKAERLRKGQQGTGRIRTGAKTATKEQERDYLERFERLAEDPSPLVPRWMGSGPDPFEGLRAQLARVSKRRGSAFWLKWYARGRKLRSAYAHTLLVQQSGRIPSFASVRLRNRDVKFILRGNGLRDKLVAVQNHDEPDARLLGYVDLARRRRVVVVSLPDDFFALPPGGPLPPEVLSKMMDEVGLETQSGEAGARCPHAAQRVHVEHEFKQLGATVNLCRACSKRLHTTLPASLEAFVLTPKGQLEETRRVRGSELVVHPPSAREEFERLLRGASDAAQAKTANFEGVTDDDLFTWADEATQKALDERREGFLLIGHDLWLGDYASAAERFGESELERRALRSAFALATPHVRASDATLNRLLEAAWSTHAIDLLKDLAGGRLDATDLAPLAAQRPSEALATLERLVQAEDRFIEYPRFDDLPAPLRLAHDLFKGHKTGDSTRFQRRLAEGVRDPVTKSLALALARAFGHGAGVEWQYAQHEKDQALFFQPAAEELAKATPETYPVALTRLAATLSLEPPTVRA